MHLFPSTERKNKIKNKSGKAGPAEIRKGRTAI